jgi:hypothetical protein
LHKEEGERREKGGKRGVKTGAQRTPKLNQEVMGRDWEGMTNETGKMLATGSYGNLLTGHSPLQVVGTKRQAHNRWVSDRTSSNRTAEFFENVSFFWACPKSRPFTPREKPPDPPAFMPSSAT